MFPDIRPPRTHVERLLKDFAKKNKPTIADFAALRSIGTMFDRLDRYRMEAQNMSEAELEAEKHSPRRLASNLRRSGDPRPSKHCDAHAIISGGHPDAIVMRGVLAWLRVRIDDPHNGCWLPRDWDDRRYMPNHLRNAVPHRRIHTKNYYGWLSARIRSGIINTLEQLIRALRMARTMLQSGAVPANVMPQTGR